MGLLGMHLFDFFRKSKEPEITEEPNIQVRGSYVGGHALGESPDHPVWVNGLVANVESANFASDVTIMNTPLEVNVAAVATGISFDVNIQDQHSSALDLMFMGNTVSVTLASNATIDTTTATFTAGHNIISGDVLCFKESSRHFQAHATNVVSNTITLDSPFDYSFTTSAVVMKGTDNIAVDGSSTSKVYRVSPLYMSNSVSWDITNLIFHIEDDSAMDDWKFGGLNALTKGIVLRKKDGDYQHIFNAKSNGQIIDHCQSAAYSSKTGGGGYGFRALKTFGGQANSGVVIRLSAQTEDELQIIVQDDLTALQDFHVVAIGHLVV